MKRSKLTTRKRVGKKVKYVEDEEVIEANYTIPDAASNSTISLGSKVNVPCASESKEVPCDSKSSTILNQFVNTKIYKNKYKSPTSSNSMEKIYNQKSCQSIKPNASREKIVKDRKTNNSIHSDDALQVAVALSESLKLHEEEKFKNRFSYYQDIGYTPEKEEAIKQGAFQSEACAILSKKERRNKNDCDIVPGLLTCTPEERHKRVGNRVASILTEQNSLTKSTSNIFQNHLPAKNLFQYITEDSPLWSLSKQGAEGSQLYYTELMKIPSDVNNVKVGTPLTDTQQVFLKLVESTEDQSIISSGSEIINCNSDEKELTIHKDTPILKVEFSRNTGENREKADTSLISLGPPDCHDDDDMDMYSEKLSASHLNRMINHYRNHDDGDLKIQCSDGFVKAHSSILRLHIPCVLPANISEINWSQFDTAVVDSFLYYIYTGRVKTSAKITPDWTRFTALIDMTQTTDTVLLDQTNKDCRCDGNHLTYRDVSSPDLFEESCSFVPTSFEKNNGGQVPTDLPTLDRELNVEDVPSADIEPRDNSSECDSKKSLKSSQLTSCTTTNLHNALPELTSNALVGSFSSQDFNPDGRRMETTGDQDLLVVSLSGDSQKNDKDVIEPMNPMNSSAPTQVQSDLSDVWDNFQRDDYLLQYSSPENCSQHSLKQSDNDKHRTNAECDVSIITISGDSIHGGDENRAEKLNMANNSNTTEVTSQVSDLWDNFPRDDFLPSSYAYETQTALSDALNGESSAETQLVNEVPDDNQTLPWSDSLNATLLAQQCSTPKNASRKEKSFTLSDTVTPKPNYLKMITPEVKKELKKYGLRNLSRKKAVTMLNFIYDQLHPYECTEKVEDNDVVESQLTQSSETSNMDILEESLILSQISKPEEGFDASVRQLIKQNPLLLSKILMYKPIEIDTFAEILKSSGIKHKQNDLLEFLDQECITYRMPENKRKLRNKKSAIP